MFYALLIGRGVLNISSDAVRPNGARIGGGFSRYKAQLRLAPDCILGAFFARKVAPSRNILRAALTIC